MNFIARLRRDGVDQAMLLFRLRAVAQDVRVITPPKGGSDLQVVGTTQDIEGLAAALPEGALHVGDQHLRVPSGERHDSIESAEADLGGPFTTPGVTRDRWSFGDDLQDHLVQILHATDRMTMTQLRESAGVRVDLAIQAIKPLVTSGVVRRYRLEGEESYGLSNDTRASLNP